MAVCVCVCVCVCVRAYICASVYACVRAGLRAVNIHKEGNNNKKSESIAAFEFGRCNHAFERLLQTGVGVGVGRKDFEFSNKDFRRLSPQSGREHR